VLERAVGFYAIRETFHKAGDLGGEGQQGLGLARSEICCPSPRVERGEGARRADEGLSRVPHARLSALKGDGATESDAGRGPDGTPRFARYMA